MRHLMTFSLFAVSRIALADADASGRSVDYVEAGEACQREGERVYIQNGEDQDVFVCENGVYKFLYKRLPNDGQD